MEQRNRPRYQGNTANEQKINGNGYGDAGKNSYQQGRRVTIWRGNCKFVTRTKWLTFSNFGTVRTDSRCTNG